MPLANQSSPLAFKPVRAQRLRADLKLILAEGATYCLMSGLGESSFAAFVLALGYSEYWSGLVATLPMFLGSLVQNVSPYGILAIGSLRSWSVLSVLLQSCAFVPLVLGASIGQLPLVLLFMSVSIYWAGGLSTGAAWNTWMESVVPRSVRGRYFSRRAAACNLIQWTSMLAAGAYLSNHHSPLQAFSVLFLLAGLSRITGAFVMSRQSEPEPLPEGYQVLSWRESWTTLRNSPQGDLLLYILAAQLGLQVAVPYLVPYLLGPLKLDYSYFMALMAAAVLARILALPLLEANTRRWSARELLTFSGRGLTFIPLLWMWSSAPLPYYFLIQIATGVLMACYDLALIFVYLEAIPAAQRASVLSRFRMLDTLAMLTGSLLGASLLKHWSPVLTTYHSIFAISAVLRLAATGLLHFGGRRQGCPSLSTNEPPSNSSQLAEEHQAASMGGQSGGPAFGQVEGATEPA